MSSDPFPLDGLALHWLGGLAAASFYAFFRGVRKWSWETYWLAAGTISWLFVPTIFAGLLTNDLFGVIGRTPTVTLLWTILFGMLWGVGAVTFGLAMRYLGLSLGMGVILGFCAAFGTLLPPLFRGELMAIVSGVSGRVVCGGIGICLIGIGLTAAAGWKKEKEMSLESKQEVVPEFSFIKGMLFALVSGVLSAAFAFGLAAAEPIAELSRAAGTASLWAGLPKLVVILWGGFASNVMWCLVLHWRRRTAREYFNLLDSAGARVPLIANYLLCAAAGLTWYLQFFFYTMGESRMHNFRFASWTLHMASIIIFSSFLGLAVHEWRGSSRASRALLLAGVAMLVAATLVVGYGNYLSTVR
jgi:L-rhamnose-H+ transport protein